MKTKAKKLAVLSWYAFCLIFGIAVATPLLLFLFLLLLSL